MEIITVSTTNRHRAGVEQIARNAESLGRKEKATKSPDTGNPQVTRSESIEKIKSVLKANQLSLQITTDSATNAVVVQVIDDTTGESVRQIPSEVSLKLAAAIQKLQGHFVDAVK